MGLLRVTTGRYRRDLTEMTCAEDGRAHLITDDAVDAAVTSGTGLYKAVCGHAVQVGSLASLPGHPCGACHAA